MAFDAPETAPAWRATVSCNLGRLPAAHEAPPELGVGLANVRRRLALAFGDAATLRLEPLTEAAQGAQGAGSGGGVLVTVQLPCVY